MDNLFRFQDMPFRRQPMAEAHADEVVTDIQH